MYGNLRKIAFAFVLLFSATCMMGQVETGTYPFGTFTSMGFDTINIGNLNVILSTPIVHKPGRGLDFQFNLQLDSSLWTPTSVNGSTVWQPSPTYGWSVDTNVVTGYVQNSAKTETVTCTSYNDNGSKMTRHARYTYLYDFSYTDTFGVKHLYSSTAESGGCPDVNGDIPTISGFTETASDGSGYTLTVGGADGTTVTTRSGITFIPPVNNTNGAGSITDTNGNIISIDGSGHFTDTTGTVVLTASGQAPNPETLTYNVSNGDAATYTLSYKSYTLQTNYGCSGIGEYGPLSGSLVDRVTLPDGTYFQYNYESTPGSNGNVTGRLASVTLPTGGIISYQYTGSNNGINCADGSAMGLIRTTSDGTWTYVRALGSGAATTTTINDPQGNQTVMQFQSTYNTTSNAYNGTASSGTLLNSQTVCYNGTTANCAATPISLPITEVATSVQVDYTGLQGLQILFYNNLGLVTQVEEFGYGSGGVGPLLRNSFNTYDSSGALLQEDVIKDGSGNVLADTRYSYDETTPTATSGVPQHISATGTRGNLTTMLSCTSLSSCSSSLSVHSTYDDTGQPLTTTDTAGNVTSLSYANNFFTDSGANPPTTYTTSAPSNAYLTQITSPLLGVTSRFGYYYGTGKTAMQTDQNSAVSYSHYDALDHLTTNYLPPSANGVSGWVEFQYPSIWETDSYTSITSSSPSTSCTGCRHQMTTFDSFGRQIESTLVSDPEGATSIQVAYDSFGRQNSTTTPYRSTGDATYGVETTSYDALGRVSMTTHADGSASHIYYGNSVAGAAGAGTQLCSTATYGIGYPTLTVDSGGKKSQHWKDGLGRLIETDEPDANGNLTVATCNLFDSLNNLLSVTQGSVARQFSYDTLSRAITRNTPEAGLEHIYYTNSTGAACSGNPALACRQSNARGITTTMTYDALNRLTSRSYSDSTPAVHYYYDQTSYNGLAITNGRGRLTGISDGSGASAMSYDLLGQIVAENHTISGVTKTIAYTYNLDGSIATVTYPSGRSLAYTYSNAQRPLSLTDQTSGASYASSVLYAPQGLQSSIIHGVNSSFAGITESYTYNNRLQLQNQTASSVNGSILNLNYGFPGSPGNNGQVSSIVNNLDTGRTQSVTYDALKRISSVNSQATSGVDCWGQGYGYDHWGNLLSMNLTQCSGGSLSVSVTNNRIATAGYSYDLSGDLTNDGVETYTYDGEGHLRSGAGVAYTYDGRDLRVAKASGTLYWRGFFGDAFSESDLSGTIQNDYIFFGGRRIARVDSGGNVYYYFSDNLGSARSITSSSGSVCYSADFTPFGTEIAFVNTCPQNYKFTGFERDSETGTDYAIYREYDQRIGRFLQPDPLTGSVSKPQSLNRYAYALNDPLNWTDKMGLSPCPAGSHPATADEARAIAAAAAAFANTNKDHHIPYGKGIVGQYPNLTSVDCTGMLKAVVNSMPNVVGISYPNVSHYSKAVYAGNTSGLTEGGSSPQVGQVVAFDMSPASADHVGIVESTSPFTFAGSQGSTGPAVTEGTAANYWNQYPQKYFTICMKDKAAAPASTSGGSGGSSSGFSPISWLINLLMPLPPPPSPPAAPGQFTMIISPGVVSTSLSPDTIDTEIVTVTDEIPYVPLETLGGGSESGDVSSGACDNTCGTMVQN